jgi:transcriptional regulator with XRE-family HTH domain
MTTQQHYLHRGREAICLSRASLAERLGVTPRTVQSWELRYTKPQATRREAWVAALLDAGDVAAERITTPTPAALAAERRAARRYRGDENARTLELARAIHDQQYEHAKDRGHMDYRAFNPKAFLYAYRYDGAFPFMVDMARKAREQDNPSGNPRPLTPREIRRVLTFAAQDNHGE